MHFATSAEFVAPSSLHTEEIEKRTISLATKTKLSIFESTVIILTQKSKLK